jgi:hypothetical protein
LQTEHSESILSYTEFTNLTQESTYDDPGSCWVVNGLVTTRAIVAVILRKHSCYR